MNFSRYLVDNKEFVISNQLLKSGTSIGANIQESQHAQGRRDFVSKLSIALKEAYETRYWLQLLHDSDTALQSRTQPLLVGLNEIIPLLITSIKTAKSKL